MITEFTHNAYKLVDGVRYDFEFTIIVWEIDDTKDQLVWSGHVRSEFYKIGKPRSVNGHKELYKFTEFPNLIINRMHELYPGLTVEMRENLE